MLKGCGLIFFFLKMGNVFSDLMSFDRELKQKKIGKPHNKNVRFGFLKMFYAFSISQTGLILNWANLAPLFFIYYFQTLEKIHDALNIILFMIFGKTSEAKIMAMKKNIGQ